MRRRQKHITTFELVCVLVVLIALAGLVLWIVTHRGGVGGFAVLDVLQVHSGGRLPVC